VYSVGVAHGVLNAAQRKVLGQHVRGKIIHDLGAGDLTLSRELLSLGAAEVYAIDKESKPTSWTWPRKLHYKQAYFHNVTSRMETIFMSWPVNHEANLLPHILGAGMVIYLGKNTDGSACGTPGLFEVMVRRELLAYEPDRKNCLIVTGKYLDSPRGPTGEELAGLSTLVNYYSYEQAEARDAG
jgi:hypothetical protein